MNGSRKTGRLRCNPMKHPSPMAGRREQRRTSTCGINMKYHTTLNKIRSFNPCEGGWIKLLKHLRKTKADDETLSLETILDSNGFQDALWSLKAVDGINKDARLFAVACVQRVAHLNPDPRVQECLNAATRYSNGDASEEELSAAESAAESAARSAAWSAAWSAARSAELKEQESLFRKFFCTK